MKHSTHMWRRLFSLLLVVALALSLFPAVSLTASAASVSTSDALIAAIEGAAPGSAVSITLTSDIYLTRIINIPSNLQLTLDGQGHSINAFGTAFTNYKDGGDSYLMFNGTLGSSTIQNVTFNANNKCHVGAVTVPAGATVTFNQVKFINGNALSGTPGLNIGGADGVPAGAGAWPHAVFTGCEFTGNVGNLNSNASYGGLDVFSGMDVQLNGCRFENNKGHSGAGLYVYQSHVKIDAATRFKNNEAGQRGGAIHCHGTVEIDGAPGQFEGNSSGQYGGTIYISANTTNTGDSTNGLVIAKNLQIQGSQAGMVGGAVFIADEGELHVSGSTNITGNTISDAEPQAGENNVYTASANSRIVVGGALAAGSQIGVSVGNPYTKKDVVFSTSETKTMPGNLASRKGLIDQAAYTSYAFTAEDEGCFKYDGEGWTILKDTEKPGPRLWLMRSSTPPGDMGTVVFDWNIRGAAAKL